MIWTIDIYPVLYHKTTIHIDIEIYKMPNNDSRQILLLNIILEDHPKA